jgi:hypothetical protein
MIAIHPVDLPRTTTRKEWYAIHRWTRQASRTMRGLFKRNKAELLKMREDMVVFGGCRAMIDGDGYMHHISMAHTTVPHWPTAIQRTLDWQNHVKGATL